MERLFSQALRRAAQQGHAPVIADIKAFSPKEGDLFGGRRAADIARILKNAGAPALSVVTEPAHFHGSIEMLRDVAAATGLPVLRKDFITGEADLIATREAGAQAILLICSMHTPSALKALFRAAHALGLEALVEAHTREELHFAGELGAQLVGINNKDILALERDAGDVSTTQHLAGGKPAGSLLVSESGIHTPADVSRALASGADAVLVGTALLQAQDMAACYRQMTKGRVQYAKA